MARIIQEHIKRPLAEELLFGRLAGGGQVPVQRLARDEEPHDLGRALEDEVDPEIAHDALDRQANFATDLARDDLIITCENFYRHARLL